MGKIKPVRQIILSPGSKNQEYMVEYDSFRFSVSPLLAEEGPDIKHVNDHPLLQIIADALRSGKLNGSLFNAPMRAWGLSRKELNRGTVSFGKLRKHYFSLVEHKDLCKKCGGKCCTDLKTSDAGNGEDVVGPLRWFETQFHKGNYIVTSFINGTHSYAVSSVGPVLDAAVPFLKKVNGKCVYWIEGKGCSAEVKPVMCSSFTCRGVHAIDKGITDAERHAACAVSDSADRVAREGSEVRERYLISGLKEDTLIKFAYSFSKFFDSLIPDSIYDDLAEKIVNLPVKVKPDTLVRKRLVGTVVPITESPGSSTTEGKILHRIPDGGVELRDKLPEDFPEYGEQIAQKVREPVEMREWAERKEQGFRTNCSSAYYPDNLQKYLTDFPVLYRYIQEMPEIIEMLERLPDTDNSWGLVNIFNYILCRSQK